MQTNSAQCRLKLGEGSHSVAETVLLGAFRKEMARQNSTQTRLKNPARYGEDCGFDSLGSGMCYVLSLQKEKKKWVILFLVKITALQLMILKFKIRKIIPNSSFL